VYATKTVCKRYVSHYLVPPHRRRPVAILFPSENAFALGAGALRGRSSEPVRALSSISHLKGLSRVVLVLLDTCEPPHGIWLMLRPLHCASFTLVEINT